MERNFDLEEYESEFASKYLKLKAQSKIKKLQEKISSLDVEKEQNKIQELENEIRDINEQLIIELDKIKTKTDEIQQSTREFVDFQTVYAEHDNIYARFIQNLDKEKQNYCDMHKIDVNEFDAHIFTNAEPVDDIKVPLIIYEKLFNFQKESISWLYSLYKKYKGGILADEMGLGKTLQIISFICSLYISKKLKYALIVAPATVLDHWVMEFKKFFPFIRICILHKTKSLDLNELLKSFSLTKGVVVLSYDGLKKYFKMINSIKFDLVVLDEGHKIKNQRSFISKFAKDLGCKCRIVLSGTPMQNNLGELWNLVDFVVPGLLGQYETFKSEFEDKIKKGGYKSAKGEDVIEAERLSKYLKQLIIPYFLRRTKKEVAGQLPRKIERVYFCELSKEQEHIYRKTIDTNQIFDVLTGKRNVLWGIDLLRKICNHPFLLEKKDVFLEGNNLVNSSGKLIILDNLLKTFKEENKKVLIFTQTISMMNILEKYCRINNYLYCKMNGKTNLNERQGLVNEFNNSRDLFIFLLTTKVGGLGLNLVGASRVVLYDPDWNPSSDNQAKERVYRYGQSDDVQIYKLITSDTIEEKILHTQIFKNLLHQKVFTNASLSRFFKKIDLDDLFTYSKDTTKRNRVEELIHDDISIKNEIVSEEEDIEQYILKREQQFNNDLITNDISTEGYEESSE